MNRSEAGKLGFIKSKDTRQRQLQNRINEYNKDPRKCGYCNKIIPYGSDKRKKFCNHSCAAAVSNIGIARNIVDGQYVKKPCIVCGNITENSKYCSSKCFLLHKWENTKQRIEESGCLLGSNAIYGYNPLMAKRYLAEIRGHKCEICGGEIWQGKPIPLVLDHINGDPTNHKLDNVRLVCGNCNMQLPTFAGKNRGKGRKNRGWLSMNHK
jgi:hypothetical protein